LTIAEILKQSILMNNKNYKKFVIQEHVKKDEGIHWDVMLETSGVLETYRLLIHPEIIDENVIDIIKIADHPLKFLTYQGLVNNGLGSVKIVDSGTYLILEQNESYKKLKLDGEKIKGIFSLKLISENKWELELIDKTNQSE